MERSSWSVLQSIVAVVAGLSSIGGATYSALRVVHATPAPGELVTIVRDASTGMPISDARIEVLTPEDDLVTTLGHGDAGLARRTVAAGGYRLRVVHPQFVDATRDVRVLPSEVAEVHFDLTRRPPRDAEVAAPSRAPHESRGSPGDRAARAVDRGVGATRRFLGRLGL